MNYRHAYHAGNFADVVKHIILTRVLEYLKRKEAPFFVLDTHAGTGRYDLTDSDAQKTLEFERGIGRYVQAIRNAPLEVRTLCAQFDSLIQSLNPDGLTSYPGSPLVAQTGIRLHDRLSLVELHPVDFKQLTEN